MSKPIARAFLIALMFAGSLFVVGCNTVKGVGQDLEAAGAALAAKAERVQQR